MDHRNGCLRIPNALDNENRSCHSSKCGTACCAAETGRMRPTSAADPAGLLSSHSRRLSLIDKGAAA